MSEKKKSKKSVTIEAAARPSSDDSMRYEPGPQFTKIKSQSLKPCVDLSGVEEGTHELWLVQMPKHINMSTINGASIQYEKSSAEASTAVPMGTLETKEGVSFDLHHESLALSKQLFVVGNNGAGLSMLPVTRRVNIDRIPSQGPVGVVNSSSLAASRDLPGQQPTETPKKSKKRQVDADDGYEASAAAQPVEEAVKSAKKKKKDKEEKKAKKKDRAADSE
jgi:hypothetical protein